VYNSESDDKTCSHINITMSNCNSDNTSEPKNDKKQIDYDSLKIDLTKLTSKHDTKVNNGN